MRIGTRLWKNKGHGDRKANRDSSKFAVNSTFISMSIFYTSACLAGGPTDFHPLDGQIGHLLDTLLDQLSVRHFVHVRAKVIIVVIQDETIDIDLADSSSHAALHQLRGEPIGTMQSQPDPTICLVANVLKSKYAGVNEQDGCSYIAQPTSQNPIVARGGHTRRGHCQTREQARPHPCRRTPLPPRSTSCMLVNRQCP